MYVPGYGFDKVFALMGGLHIEMMLLTVHGKLIEGSGLDAVISVSDVSVLGTGNALVGANDVARARHVLQIALVALYKLLDTSHKKSKSSLSIEEWVNEQSMDNDNIFYWTLVM